MGVLAAIAAADADVFPGFFAFAADAFCSFVLLDTSLRESSGLAAVRGRGGAMVTYVPRQKRWRERNQGRSRRATVGRGRNDGTRQMYRIDAGMAIDISSEPVMRVVALPDLCS